MTATPQDGQTLIDNFEQDTGDTSELSSTAELTLANKIYRKILADRDWLFLRKGATGTISVTNGIATITPPTDFDHFTINGLATDIAVGADQNGFGIGNASPKVIFVSTATGVFTPYQIINFSDRRQYYNKNGYCYYDMVNNLITFTVAPTTSDLSYEFDYIYSPDDIGLATFPVIPAQFHDIIHHGMAAQDVIFQLFDRSKSYSKENFENYTDYLTNLQFWDAQFNMN